MPNRPLRHYHRIKGGGAYHRSHPLVSIELACRNADIPARRLTFPNINSAIPALGVSWRIFLIAAAFEEIKAAVFNAMVARFAWSLRVLGRVATSGRGRPSSFRILAD